MNETRLETVKHPSQKASLEDLISRSTIHKVLIAYCQGVDRRDWEQVRSCYHEDARDSHGPFRGGREDLIAWLRQNHEGVSFCMHTVGNVSIDISDEEPRLARAETYCISHKTVASAESDPYFAAAGVTGPLHRTIACRYIDTFENRPEVGWKILERTVVHEWMRRESSDLYVDMDPTLEVSRRDSTDLLYSPLPQLSPKR